MDAFRINALTLVVIGSFSFSFNSHAACTTTNAGPNGSPSRIVTTSSSACTTAEEIFENLAGGSSVIVDASGSSILDFTADNVTITNNIGSNGKNVSAKGTATINFGGNLNVLMNGTSPSQNYGILLQDSGTINIEKDLLISGNADGSLIFAGNGSLSVKGNSKLFIEDPTLRGTIILAGPNPTSSQLTFSGKTEIVNRSNASTSIIMHGDSVLSFNELDYASSGVNMDMSVNNDSAIVSNGITTINSAKRVVLNVNTADTTKGVISLGENQSVIDQQLNNRSNTLVNIGALANITNHGNDAVGIRIMGGTADTVSDIVIKGVVDIRNGTAISGNGNGIERVSINGGSVYGLINLGKSNDILTANSGVIDGEIVMGRGSDTLILNQAIDITNLVKANGNDPMYTQAADEINQLQVNGLSFAGYTSLVDNSSEGTNFTNWDSVFLNNGATLTLSSNLFESTEDRSRSLTIDSTSSLIHHGDQTIADRTIFGRLNNSGGVILSNNIAGDTLTVTSDYVGQNGLIAFDTVLGDDASVTDHLTIQGNTSGTTRVSVTNVGGTGALTANGIEIIQVNGNSEGQFVKEGRIIGGAYEYFLQQGNGSENKNWYLVSQAEPIDPVDPTTPTPPTDPNDIEKPVKPTKPQVNRPEIGSYIANLAEANTMFVTRLHDRLGETQYIDALTGEKKVTSMWLRQIGGHTRFRDSSGQLKTQSNRYVVQLGGDIAQWSSDNLDRYHLGLMTGYGNSHSNTDSALFGASSRGSVDGYSVGIYGTWYANDAEKNGTYVDTWAQYSWFNNTVNGDGLNAEKYKSSGITASIETGYTHKLGTRESDNVSYFIQPKAQVIWMGIEADDHNESQGIRVKGAGENNVQTRLGLRAYRHGHSTIDNGKDREFEPFVEANWIHNTNNFGAQINGTKFSQDGTKNIGELKLGVEGQWNKQLNLWGNVGVQVGDAGYSDTAVIVGVKYNF